LSAIVSAVMPASGKREMMTVRDAAEGFAHEAIGRSHRDDAVLDGTGGPAGNARLTAWTGLLLLALFLAELATLLNLGGLLSWHIVIGVLLIPPALLKTGSTGWRIVRYYAGNRPYRDAGPPTLLLRLLGPLVVASTLAVLGTGVALILISPSTGRHGLFTVGAYAISPLFLHKVAFVGWAVATGLHTIGRLIPALRLTVVPVVSRRIPGRFTRGATVAVTVAVAIVASVLALSVATPWRSDAASGHHDHHRYVRSR
jgi:hypothetical protein